MAYKRFRFTISWDDAPIEVRGYCMPMLVAIYTGTTSTFTPAASNCIAQSYVTTNKELFIQCPSSAQRPTVYFKFIPKCLLNRPSVNMVNVTTTSADSSTMIYTVTIAAALSSNNRCINKKTVNLFALPSTNLTQFEDSKTDTGAVIEDTALAKKSDIPYFIPYNTDSRDPDWYNCDTASSNQYLAMNQTERYHTPLYPPVYSSAAYVLPDMLYKSSDQYVGYFSLNTLTSGGAKQPAHAFPSTSSSYRVTTSTYDFCLTLRGFQRWQSLEVAIFWLNANAAQGYDRYPILSSADYLFASRAASSGTTAQTVVYCTSSASSMTTFLRGANANVVAFARKSVSSSAYPTGEWAKLSIPSSVFNDVGNTNSQYPTIYVEIPEEYKTIQINGLFQVTSIPAHATHYIGVQVTYQIKYGSSASTDYTSQTATITGTIGSSTSTSQMNHTIATDKSFSVKERYYYNAWVHATSVKYQKASGGSWYTATISDTSYYQITNGSISTAAFRPVASITWAALQ